MREDLELPWLYFPHSLAAPQHPTSYGRSKRKHLPVGVVLPASWPKRFCHDAGTHAPHPLPVQAR